MDPPMFARCRRGIDPYYKILGSVVTGERHLTERPSTFPALSIGELLSLYNSLTSWRTKWQSNSRYGS